jgi:hypothetical protein
MVEDWPHLAAVTGLHHPIPKWQKLRVAHCITTSYNGTIYDPDDDLD